MLKGDELARVEVYQRHWVAVVASARRIAGDDHAARDIAQEVFVRWWNDLTAYDVNRASILGWLRRIDRAREVVWLRRERAVHRRERWRDPGVMASEDVEGAAINQSLAQDVRIALAELRPLQREAIALAFLEGMTYRQVAEVLGVPEGTVKGRIRSGLSALVTVMESWGPAAEDVSPRHGGKDTGLGQKSTGRANEGSEPAG